MRRVHTISGLSLLAFMLCITGCWDRIEMEDRALVMGSGIDLTEDGQLEVTLQIALPTGLTGALQGGGGAGADPFIIVSDKGRNGREILSKLQGMLSRRIFLGHRGVIIFGEEYAKQGIDEIVDSFMRAPDARYTSYMLTVKGETAKEVLNTPHQFLEEIPALGLLKKQTVGVNLSVIMDEFMDALASDGKSPVTGAIKIMTDKAGGEKIFKLDEAAVYRDHKLAGFLPEEEMKALLLLRGEGQGQNIEAQIEPFEEGFSGTVGVRILKSKVKIDVNIKNDLPEFNITIKPEGLVFENNTKLDLSKEKNLKHVEEKLNKQVEKKFTSILDHIKEYKSDVCGFGNEIHIQHPHYWKKNKDKWKEVYPEVPIHTEVDFTILGTGRAQAPPHMKK